VACGTTGLTEEVLTSRDRCADSGVVRDYLSGDLQCDLVEGDRSHIGGCQLIDKAVTVGTNSDPKPLFIPDAMVVVECIVYNLTHQHDGSSLMEWPDDETGRRSRASDSVQGVPGPEKRPSYHRHGGSACRMRFPSKPTPRHHLLFQSR
jgi:hypothetical protein